MGAGGVFCMKTGNTVLIGVYDDAVAQPSQARTVIKKLADQFGPADCWPRSSPTPRPEPTRWSSPAGSPGWTRATRCAARAARPWPPPWNTCWRPGTPPGSGAAMRWAG
ncbi:hypothetical protein HS041_36075 [Planomonospora sp. ID67723]|nr:hypothetical protein [Planomonospora sp. ID67723]